MCSRFTGEYPCRNVISIRLFIKFIEMTFWHRFSPASLLYIFKTSFPKNTSGWPLLPLLILRNIDYKCDEDSRTFPLPLKHIHFFFFFIVPLILLSSYNQDISACHDTKVTCMGNSNYEPSSEILYNKQSQDKSVHYICHINAQNINSPNTE